MLLAKFLPIIDNSIIGKTVLNKQKIIERTDPDRIYIENIRSFFNLPFSTAKFFCELAVKEKIFNRKIGYICSNNDCERIILSVSDGQAVPDDIICEQCKLKEEDDFVFQVNTLDKLVFYQLIQ